MESLIHRTLCDEFRLYCQSFERPDIADFVETRLQQPLQNNGNIATSGAEVQTVLHALTQRNALGRPTDLQQLIDSEFTSIPLGLRIKLQKMVINICNQFGERNTLQISRFSSKGSIVGNDTLSVGQLERSTSWSSENGMMANGEGSLLVNPTRRLSLLTASSFYNSARDASSHAAPTRPTSIQYSTGDLPRPPSTQFSTINGANFQDHLTSDSVLPTMGPQRQPTTLPTSNGNIVLNCPNCGGTNCSESCFPNPTNSGRQLSTTQSDIINDHGNVNPLLARIHREWCRGAIDSVTFFHALSEAVAHGFADSNQYWELATAALREGGYEPRHGDFYSSVEATNDPDIALDEIKFGVINGICVDGVSSLQSDVENGEIVLHGYDGSMAIVPFSDIATGGTTTKTSSKAVLDASPPNFRVRRSSGDQSTPAVSTHQFRWTHVGGSKQLLLLPQKFRPPSNSTTSNPTAVNVNTLGNTSTSHPPRSDETYQLIIGDCIETARGTVEVDRIISLDALRLGSSGDQTNWEFVFLLEGRWVCSLSEEEEMVHLCDGASEIAKQEEHSTSPNGSGNEDNPHIIPDYSYATQWFLVFGACVDECTVVHSVVSLEDIAEPDQVPIQVRYATTGLVFVSGSHGLLAMGTRAVGRPLMSPMARDFATEEFRLQLMTVDTLAIPPSAASTVMTASDAMDESVLPGPVGSQPGDYGASGPSGYQGTGAPLSHSSEAVIISLDFQLSCQRLVSLDDSGVVCVWDISFSGGLSGGGHGFSLAARPYHLQRSRVYSATLSPSGEHIAVALFDSLVLLRVLPCAEGSLSTNTGLHSQSRQFSSNYFLYERCSLDMIEGRRCLYSTIFTPKSIFIWRLSDSPTSDYSNNGEEGTSTTNMLISVWQHRNLDEFGERLSLAPVISGNGYAGSYGAGRWESRGRLTRSATESAPSCFPDSSETDQTGLSGRGESNVVPNTVNRTGNMVIPAMVNPLVNVDLSGVLGNNDLHVELVGEEVVASLPQLQRSRSSVAVLPGEQFMPVGKELLPVYRPARLSATWHSQYVSSTSGTGDCGGGEGLDDDVMSLSDGMEDGIVSESSPQNNSELEDSESIATRVSDKPTVVGTSSGGISRSFYNMYGLVRPVRSQAAANGWIENVKLLRNLFGSDKSDRFHAVKPLLAAYAACYQPPTAGLLCALLEVSQSEFENLLSEELGRFLVVSDPSNANNTSGPKAVVTIREEHRGLVKWICSLDHRRLGGEFWIDVCIGHNLLCALYLRYCGNKSVAVEHAWQSYLHLYGPTHLRHCSRGLRQLTTQIRKLDETAGIKYTLPYQIGYISGLQEVYARRVGLSGKIPKEIGQLHQLRVLSMGNNRLTGKLPEGLGRLRHLQRIVLHQNNLVGSVPESLGLLGCIVNLAGNPRLQYGPDVPAEERQALVDLFNSTKGLNWNTHTHWASDKPVAKWYKVGVLSSHVHSLVMSSNGMDGHLPASVASLKSLRMIELATMPGLTGNLPPQLCTLTTLRRLCICRCGLTGPIPEEIGRLVGLEELQLFGNKLNGSIPESLGNLVNLKLLSLGEYTGGNNFSTEPLPQCISRLTKLEALFMANCNIRGSLPSWIGELVELRQLDLQRNQITGTIPRSVGRLENLLYLNIKDNISLGGELPLRELLSLTRLNRLSLVHCSFQRAEEAVETLRLALPRCKIWI